MKRKRGLKCVISYLLVIAMTMQTLMAFPVRAAESETGNEVIQNESATKETTGGTEEVTEPVFSEEPDVTGSNTESTEEPQETEAAEMPANTETPSQEPVVSEEVPVPTEEPEQVIGKIALVCDDYSTKCIKLSWTPEQENESGDLSYDVYRNGELLTTVTEQKYEDLAVEQTAYTYYVEGKDKDGKLVAKSENLLVNARDDLTLTQNYTLTEDMTVKNLYMSNYPNLNLNGYELTVLGNIVQSNGTIDINKGKLSCMGNYSITAYAYLNMDDPNDMVVVEGNVTWSTYYGQTLTAGDFYVRGNLTVNSNYFVTAGTHTMYFDGTNGQTISFSSVTSYMTNVVLENRSVEGITCNGPLHAIHVKPNGTKVNVGAEGIYGVTLQEDMVWQEDTTLLLGNLDLNGHNLTIEGDFTQLGGDVILNGGTLTITGDYAISNKKDNNGQVTYNASFGRLVMQNADDRLIVGGNFRTYSVFSSDGILTEGCMEIKGNLTQVTAYSNCNLRMTNNLKLILNGEGGQSVSFGNPDIDKSQIANLSIENSSEEGVSFLTNVYVTKWINDNGNYVKGSGSIVPGQNAHFENNCYHGRIINYYNRTLSSEFHLYGTLHLLYYTLTLGADLIIEEDLIINGGNIAINGKHVTVKGNITNYRGNMHVQKGLLDCIGNFSLVGGYWDYSYLFMQYNEDRVNVHGNFVAASSCYNTLSAGTLNLKGNFTQRTIRDSNNFRASGTHVVELSGDKKQTILFDNSNSGFNIVNITNKSEDGVVAPKGLNANVVNRNGCKLQIDMDGQFGWTLEEDQVIDGDLVLVGDTLDLNGHRLTVTGNLIQPGGIVDINNGILEVKGNYDIVKKNAQGGNEYSNGYLKMVSEQDTLVVDGNFVMGSNCSHAGYLTNGEMKLKGNFTQITYSNNQNFATTNQFKLIICGEEAQNIQISSGAVATSCIASLEITNSANQVTLGGVAVTKSFADNGNEFNGSVILVSDCKVKDHTVNGVVVFQGGGTVTQELHVTKDAYIRNNNVTFTGELKVDGNLSVETYCYLAGAKIGHDMYVRGNCYLRGDVKVDGKMYVNSTLELSGHTVDVAGNTKIDNGYLYLKRGKYYSHGDFIQRGTTSNWSSCCLYMEYPEDYVLVEGNFTAASAYNATMTNGVIELKGDFTHEVLGYNNNFLATGNHTVIFSGDRKQTVKFASNQSAFSHVIIKYSENGEVYCSAGINAADIKVEENAKYTTDADGRYGWTLTEDETLDSLYLTCGTLDLNGHTLTVKGNLFQSAGKIQINHGTLNVLGDYRIQGGNESAPTGSCGYLIMQNENDHVVVEGNFVMGSYYSQTGLLTAGTLEVKKNVTQVVYRESRNFITTKDFTLKLSGDSEQNINFASTGNGNNVIANLVIAGGEGQKVKFGSNGLAVSVSVDDGGNTSDGTLIGLPGVTYKNGTYHGTLLWDTPQTIQSNLTIIGDLTITNDITCRGNLSVQNRITLYRYLHMDHNEITAGSIYLSQGIINVNHGRVISLGDMILDGANYSSAGFNMNYSDDTVLVYGDFTVKTGYNTTMKAGELRIWGDFSHTSTYNANNFTASGNHKTIFCGDKKQTIHFGNTVSGFQNLIIDNSSDDGVWMDSSYVNAVTVEQRNGKLHVGNNGVFGWTLSGDEVIEDNIYLASGTLDLNGHNLILHGNLLVGSGDLRINGGKLTVDGDLIFQSITSKDGAETVTYGNSSGMLVMKNELDEVEIKGNFIMKSQKSSGNCMTAGKLILSGDFYQYNANSYNFRSEGSHQVILNGTKQQYIYFENPSVDNSFFNELKIQNTSQQGVTLKSNIAVRGALSDPAQKMNTVYTAYLYKMDQLVENVYGGNIQILQQDVLNRNVIIKGSLLINRDFNLNGHSMTVGNLSLNDYTLTMGGGSLIVNGNMTINYYGRLRMTNDEERITVSGNFVMGSGYDDHSNALTAGTLEVKGDFTQQGYATSFVASGTHTTILSGKSGTSGRSYIQVVRFNSPTTSHFNKVILTKSPSFYYFVPDINKVCKELINNSSDEIPPEKVQNVKLTVQGATKIKATWEETTDDMGVAGYEVYRGNMKVATVTKPQYLDSGLAPNTTYLYKVCAFDEARNLSKPSDVVAATTLSDEEPPSVPTGVKVKTKTGSSITLAWSASKDDVKIEGYNIYRDGEKVAHIGATTSYKDTGLELDHLYTYEVTAVDSVGNESERSEPIKGTVRMPEITSLVPAENAQIGGNSVTLTVYYVNVGNSQGNKVQYEYKKESGWEKINSVLLGQQGSGSSLYSSYVWDIKKVPNGKCDIRCTLYDEDGNSCVEKTTYFIDTMGPEAPTEVKAKSVNSIVTLTWMPSDSGDCVKYNIYRATSEDGAYELIGSVNGASTTEYTDYSTVEGMDYYYKVSSVDNFNQEGKLSEAAYVKADKDLEIPIVTSIQCTKARANKVADINIAATDNVGVIWASLEYQDKEGKWNLIGTTESFLGGVGVIHWNTTSLEDGDYKVRAYAKDENGNTSSHIIIDENEYDMGGYVTTITVDNTGIGKIKIKSAESYANYVSLKWDTVSEEDFGYFSVEQKKGEEFVEVAKSSTTLGAHIQNLSVNTQYVFRVVGYDNIGNRGIESDEITITTKEDELAPVVKEFGPGAKYFRNSIPLSIVATDNIGIRRAVLKYSIDEETWILLDERTLSEGNTYYKYEYNMDVSQIQEGKIYVQAFFYDEQGNESNYNGLPIENDFTIDRTAPEAVKNVKAEGLNGYVGLAWEQPEEHDISHFTIYRADEETGNYQLLANNVESYKYYDTSAEYGRAYSYKVYAVDFAGNTGDWSNEAFAQVGVDDEAPVIQGISPYTESCLTGTQEIMVAVTDNVLVNTVTFEYKKQDSEEDVWSDLGTVTLNARSGYPSVKWDVSKLENCAYEIRVTAVDGEENESKAYEAVYHVDTEAPEVPQFKASPAGYSVFLSWDSCKDDDFYYYELRGKLVSDEDYTLLTQTKKGLSYVHENLKPGRKYEYILSVYDKAGNVAQSEAVSAIPTNDDKSAPVAMTSENMSVRVGAELILDATGSHDNVKIVKYLWDFGDGTTGDGAIVRHRFKEMGKYIGKLTVIDRAGNKDIQEFTVYVRSRISAKVNISVGNVSGNNTYSMSYAYVYIEKDGIGVTYNADSYGELSVVLDAGTYIVDAYKEGYMPVSRTLTVTSGEEKKMVIQVEKGELVTGKITTKRLTLDQLIDLGVDLQDENNWYSYTYTFNHKEPNMPQLQQSTVTLSSKATCIYEDDGRGGGTSGGGTFGGGGSGGTIWYGKVDNFHGKRVVTIYKTYSYLKRMYEVDLEVTNNAEAGYGFDIINSTATLELPSGLSLLKTAEGQSFTNSLGTVEAQKTVSTAWYIRADRPGKFGLSAGFNGTLMPFEAPVATTIKADKPLVVEEEEDNTFTDEGFLSGTPVDYILKVQNKDGQKLKGAIVYLSRGSKKCSAITNSYGAARLETDNGGGYNLFVSCPGYKDFNKSYFLNRDGIDTITLYKPGEIEGEELGENPYMDEKYKIKLISATMNGKDVIRSIGEINCAVDSVYSFSFHLDQSIDSYTVTAGGKELIKGNPGESEFSCSVQSKDIKKDQAICLTVQSGKMNEYYTLNVDCIFSLYRTVDLKDNGRIVDLLTEAAGVQLEGKDKYNDFLITCQLWDGISIVDHFQIVQDDKKVAESKDGKFKLYNKELKPSELVYVVAFDKENKVIDKTRLYLSVIGNVNIGNIILEMTGIQGLIDDGCLMVKGIDFTIPNGNFFLDYTLSLTEDGFEIGFGPMGEDLDDGEGNVITKANNAIKNKLPEWLIIEPYGTLKGAYLEDEDTKEVSLSGEIGMKIGVSPSFDKQVCAWPPIVVEIEVNGEFGVGMNGEIKLTMTEEDTQKICSQIALAYSASLGIDLFGGIGVEHVASIGIFGAASAGAEGTIIPELTVDKVTLSGKAGVRAKAFGWSNDWELLSGEYVIYDKEKEDAIKGHKANAASLYRSVLDPQSYQEKNILVSETSRWLGGAAEETSDTIGVLKTETGTDLQTRLISCGDTTLLFFTDTKAGVEVEDASTLYYSVYNKSANTWSEPKEVIPNELADYYPDVATDGEHIYVTWNEAKQSLKGVDSLEETTKLMEVRAAIYDASADKFTEFSKVTDNSIYEQNLQITATNGKPVIIWYENSEENPFGCGGTNQVKKAELEGEEWNISNVASFDGIITSIDAGCLNGEMVTACTLDMDNDLSTTDDQKAVAIRLSDEDTKELAVGNCCNTMFANVNGKQVLTWLLKEKIYSIDSMQSEPAVLFEKAALRSGDYQLFGDEEGNNSLVYAVTKDNASQIYMVSYDKEAGAWGSIMPVTDQEEYIGEVSGIFQNQKAMLVFGKQKASWNEQSGKFDVEEYGSLCWMQLSGEAKPSIENVTYKSKEVIPGGDVTLTTTVDNKGTGTADSVKLTVKNEEGETVAEENYSAGILMGESKDLEILVPLPYTLNAKNYQVIATMNGTEAVTEENTHDVVLGYADLAVSRRIFVHDGNYTIQAAVENKGIQPAGGKVVFYNFDNPEEILYTEEFEPVNYGEEKLIRYEVDSALLEAVNQYNIGVKVETDEKQGLTRNDITIASLYGLHSTEPISVVFDYQSENYTNVTNYVNQNGTVEFPQDPYRDGYTFNGWYCDGVRYTSLSKVTEDIILVPAWTENPSGGTGSSGGSVVVPGGEPGSEGGENVPPEKDPTDDKKDDGDTGEGKGDVTEPLPKKGTIVTVGGFVFKITKSSKTDGTVTLVKPKKKTITITEVPATVMIKGYRFKVTRIAADAFKNCRKLKRVTIGSNVSSIGSNAFSGCLCLKNIFIKSSRLASIGKNVWKGIHKKAVIYVPIKKETAYGKLFKGKGQKKTVRIKGKH